MKKKYDVVIIGGGAAGMCCAAALKMQDRSIDVAVIEQLQRVGKKLITTGNGRCNITNRNEDLSHFHSENSEFARYALETYGNVYIENFFADLGIVFTYDEVGRAYPYSLQAASVVDALRFYLDKTDVHTLTEKKVVSISKSDGVYELKTHDGDSIMGDAVLVASGLYSGGEKSGSNGSIFKILKSNGYKTVKTTPAIVQLRTENAVTKSLKGIKVNADATLIINGQNVRSDYGEVLFCDYGLSGPPIMQISRQVERENGDIKVSLDLATDYTFERLLSLLQFRVSALRGTLAEEFFTGFLNKRVGQAIIKLCGKKLSDSVDLFTSSDLKNMAHIIKNFEFKVLGSTGFENSQVTAGGIATSEIDCETMMSKRDKGLFFAGEILDVDGDCGGFNLHWAWSSALCAADGIIKYSDGR